MAEILPINIDALLHFRGVESSRVEFKSSWDEQPSGTAAQVLRTICAFANDVQNLNGGYVVLGVAEENGKAVLPPKGLDPAKIEGVQRLIRGNCNRISPTYQPVMSPEIIDGKHILVIWAPGGDNRPYEAPSLLQKEAPRHYYIRQGSETVAASDEMLRVLMQMTARLPFDDRRALSVSVDRISSSLVREHLESIQSRLVSESSIREIYKRMRLTAPVNGHEAPRNIALLMFTDDPEEWFPGARIEVAQFPVSR